MLGSLLCWGWSQRLGGRHRGRIEERPGHGAEILTAGSRGRGALEEEEPGEAGCFWSCWPPGAQVTSGPLGAYRPPTAWQPSKRSSNDPECGQPLTKGMDCGLGRTGRQMSLPVWGPESRCFPLKSGSASLVSLSAVCIVVLFRRRNRRTHRLLKL